MATPAPEPHGRLKCGTVSAPEFEASLADYAGALGLSVAEKGVIPAGLAAAWCAPACAGRRYALLHGGGRPGWLRLIEADPAPGFRPLITAGWAAFECAVADVDALYARLGGSAFDVIGPPARVGEFASFIPFQVAGRSGEVLYLNQVLSAGVDGLELPFAEVPVDAMFIAVLAAPDADQTLAFQVEALGLEQGGRYTLPITVLNRAMGWADHRPSTLVMSRSGPTPAVENDHLPEAARRHVPPGALPPGNAMVSMIVRALESIRAPLLGPPVCAQGPLYRGRRVACVRGPAGEIYELIEDPAP